MEQCNFRRKKKRARHCQIPIVKCKFHDADAKREGRDALLRRVRDEEHVALHHHALRRAHFRIDLQFGRHAETFWACV